MEYQIFNTEIVTKQIVSKISEVDELGEANTILMNPDTTMKFPVCVVQPPIQTPRYHGGGWNLEVTVEVWSDSQYQSMRLFDLVKSKLTELNYTMTNNTPLMQDPVTKKWRFGGYFEARWNAILNTLEPNR